MVVAGPGFKFDVFRIDRQRRPDLHLSRRILERRAHDTNYGMGEVLQADNLSDDVRVSCIATLPEAVTQDDNTILTGLVLIFGEAAAQGGFHSQQREEVCRDTGPLAPFGFAITREDVAANAAQYGHALHAR